MKAVNKVSIKFWTLLPIVIFYTGCSNNYNDTIQPSTSTENAEIEVRMPIASYQPDRDKEN